ncbi:MAG: RNA polymerase sigma factor [Actinomycetota bacterium]
MAGDRTDAEVIKASLEVPDEFGEIFERHFDVISRYVERSAGGEVAEEVASETFVQGFRSRERYDLSRENARPWLFGIATNLLRHHWRDEVARLRAYSKLDPPSSADEDPEAARVALIGILEQLKDLDHKDRDALLLYAWADLSYLDISEALSVPIGTVRSRINRARSVLRELAGTEEATGGAEFDESKEEETSE